MQRYHLVAALEYFKDRFDAVKSRMSYYAFFCEYVTYDAYRPVYVLERYIAHLGHIDLNHMEEFDLINQLVECNAFDKYKDAIESAILKHSMFTLCLPYERQSYPEIKAHIQKLSSTLQCFSKAGLLTKDHSATVLEFLLVDNDKQRRITAAIHEYINKPVFSIDFFYAVLSAKKPGHIAMLYSILYDCELLVQNKYLLQDDQTFKGNIARTLKWIQTCNPLLTTQANLDSIIMHRALLTHHITEILSDYSQMLTQASLDRLFQLLESSPHKLYKVITRYIQTLKSRKVEINYQQSTHNSAADLSINASVVRLTMRYPLSRQQQKEIVLETAMWLNHLAAPNIFSHIKDQLIYYHASSYMTSADAGRNNRAMQFISFLMLSSLSIGVWPFSRVIHADVSLARRVFFAIMNGRNLSNDRPVETQHLLALTWRAIHDDQLRIGTLHDAKTRFVECLSQITTNHSGTTYICPKGTFNKIAESLDGVHPDVCIHFVTRETFNLKSIVVSNVVINEYLLNIFNEKPQDVAANRVLAYLDQLESETPDEIIDAVYPEVKRRLMLEFGDDFERYLSREAIALADFKDQSHIRERARHILQLTTNNHLKLTGLRKNI